MSEVIKDGTGTGNVAKVDENNRLYTLSVSEGYSIEATRIGQNYNLNTGEITLTSANKSAVAYLKNNSDKDFVIEKVLVILGASTGGTGDLRVDLVKNPTAGTIVSGANNFDVIENRNFGSNKALEGLTYKGAEASTITDGDLFADTTRTTAGTVVSFDSDVIFIPRGSSIGVEVTPQSSNTSMGVKVAIIGFNFF